MINELKKIFRQSSIYGFGAVVSPIVSFLMLPLYTRYLEPEDYGVLTLTGIVAVLVTSIAGLGIRSGLVRIFYSYDNKTDRDAVITSSVIFSVASSALFCVVLFSAAPYTAGYLFMSAESVDYFRLVIITAFFSITSFNFLDALRSEEKAKSYVIVTLSMLVLTLVLNYYFVAGLNRGVRGILEAGLIGNAALCILLAPMVLKGKKMTISAPVTKEILMFGLPFVPSLIIDIVLSVSDRYFLGHFCSMRDVGIYSIGYRIASVVSLLITKPFKMAWVPYMFSVSKRPDAKNIYRNVLVCFVFVSVWSGLALSMFAREGLIILTSPQYYGAWPVVPVVALGYCIYGMDAVLVAGIHITKKTKYIPWLFFVSGAADLILNFILIPTYGMMGAAVSTVVSYVILDVLYFYYSQKLYPIEHEFARIAKVFAAGTALYLISLPLNSVPGLSAPILLKLIIFAAFPLVLFFAGFFKPAEKAAFLNFTNKIRQIVINKTAKEL